MTEPTHEGQQAAIHMMLGFIPVLKVRFAIPAEYGAWEWSRWRMANLGEVVAINATLMGTWRK